MTVTLKVIVTVLKEWINNFTSNHNNDNSDSGSFNDTVMIMTMIQIVTVTVQNEWMNNFSNNENNNNSDCVSVSDNDSDTDGDSDSNSDNGNDNNNDADTDNDNGNDNDNCKYEKNLRSEATKKWQMFFWSNDGHTPATIKSPRNPSFSCARKRISWS